MMKQRERLKIRRRSSRKLRWGVAGLGRFTESSFLPVLQQRKKNKLVAVYSSDLQRAKSLGEQFSADKYFNDFDAFLESDFEAIYIGSADVDHYQQVIKAAKAGKKILCEKPLALNSKEAEEMVRVCEENKVPLAVNYLYRYHPLVLKSKEIIDKNMLGKIVSMSASFNIDYAPNDNFRFKKNLSGGGALRDLGSHMIDLLRFFGGNVSEIKGYTDNVVYNSEVEDFACAILKFEKGGYGYFNVSYNAKKASNRIEVLGHKGSLSIDNLITSRFAGSRLTINLAGEAKKAFRTRTNKMNYLIKSVQRSFLKGITPKANGNDGLINIKLMEELENK